MISLFFELDKIIKINLSHSKNLTKRWDVRKIIFYYPPPSPSNHVTRPEIFPRKIRKTPRLWSSLEFAESSLSCVCICGWDVKINQRQSGEQKKQKEKKRSKNFSRSQVMAKFISFGKHWFELSLQWARMWQMSWWGGGVGLCICFEICFLKRNCYWDSDSAKLVKI